MRAARVLALAWRDLRLVHAGRGWMRLPALALGLLLPLGSVPLRLARPAETAPVVAGEIPAALQGVVAADPSARVRLEGERPVVVRGGPPSQALREALDRLPGPQIEIRRAPLRLPGRALLIGLIAISLLTGPLAESLPGERSSRTLEVLLTTSNSRAEILVGKWLAWVGFSGAVAGLSVLGGALSGAAPPSAGLLALPAALSVAVALGLFLVREAGDVLSGAAVPMRVLPAVAMGLYAASWALADTPQVAAAIPLGGALALASGLLPSSGLAVCWISAAATTAILLGWTAVSLQASEATERRRGGVWGPWAVGLAVWALAVGGPGVWTLAGNPNLQLPEGANQRAGGGLLLALAVALAARDGAAPAWGSGRGLGLGLGAGLALGLGDPWLRAWALPLDPTFAPVLQRLSAPPSGALEALLIALGAGLLFLGVLVRRGGRAAAGLGAALVLAPLHPAAAVVGGGLLSALGARAGLGPALLAAAIWQLSRL